MNYIAEFYPFLSSILKEVSYIIQGYFRSHDSNFIQFKKDTSPVTIADQKTEEYIRNQIHKEFPHHGIIAEEFGNENEDAEFTWVIDPIDGTKSFICGALTFASLIGLLHKGKPVLGVLYHPILKDILIGDNQQTLLNNHHVTIRQDAILKEARLLTTDVFNIEIYQDLNKFKKLHSQVTTFRSLGDAYGYYLLCTGYSEIMVDPILNAWDILPLIPIIRGAKGAVFTFNGEEEPLKWENAIACSPSLKQHVQKILCF